MTVCRIFENIPPPHPDGSGVSAVRAQYPFPLIVFQEFLKGNLKCRLYRMIPKVPLRIRPLARDKDLACAIKHEFFIIIIWCLS
jgi:hypothetical protein